SVRAFASLLARRHALLATTQGVRDRDDRSRASEREWREAYQKTADHDVSWRCTLSADPAHPVESTEGRFVGDWGKVTRRGLVRLAPKNAFDPGEEVTLYEVAGRKRAYRFRAYRLRAHHD